MLVMKRQDKQDESFKIDYAEGNEFPTRATQRWTKTKKSQSTLIPLTNLRRFGLVFPWWLGQSLSSVYTELYATTED